MSWAAAACGGSVAARSHNDRHYYQDNPMKYKHKKKEKEGATDKSKGTAPMSPTKHVYVNAGRDKGTSSSCCSITSSSKSRERHHSGSNSDSKHETKKAEEKPKKKK